MSSAPLLDMGITLTWLTTDGSLTRNNPHEKETSKQATANTSIVSYLCWQLWPCWQNYRLTLDYSRVPGLNGFDNLPVFCMSTPTKRCRLDRSYVLWTALHTWSAYLIDSVFSVPKVKLQILRRCIGCLDQYNMVGDCFLSTT